MIKTLGFMRCRVFIGYAQKLGVVYNVPVETDRKISCIKEIKPKNPIKQHTHTSLLFPRLRASLSQHKHHT